MRRTMSFMFAIFFLLILSTNVYAVSFPINETVDATYPPGGGDGTSQLMGIIFTTNTSDLKLTDAFIFVTTVPGHEAVLLNSTKEEIANASIVAGVATFDFDMPYIGLFYVGVRLEAGEYFQQENPTTLPTAKEVLTFNGSFFCSDHHDCEGTMTEDVRARLITAVEFENSTSIEPFAIFLLNSVSKLSFSGPGGIC